MYIMKAIFFFTLIIFYLPIVCYTQSVDSIPERYVYPQHLYIEYNGELLKFTSSTSMDFWYLKPGFEKCPDTKYIYSLSEGLCYAVKCHLIPNIDTINTIKWLNETLPLNPTDSSILIKKMVYNYIMNKFEEQRLNNDSIKKLRFLFPLEFYNAQKDIMLIKAIFYKDSTVIVKKIIRDMLNPVVETYTLFANERKIQSIKNEINSIAHLSGYEYFNHDYYSPLLEYFDGNIEHTYISCKRCLPDKKIYKPYEKIISILWDLPKKGKKYCTQTKHI